jgi:hypothetical protein
MIRVKLYNERDDESGVVVCESIQRYVLLPAYFCCFDSRILSKQQDIVDYAGNKNYENECSLVNIDNVLRGSVDIVDIYHHVDGSVSFDVPLDDLVSCEAF